MIEVFRNSPATRCEEDSNLALARTIAELIVSSSEEGGNSSSDGAIVVYQWPSEEIAEPDAQICLAGSRRELQPTSYRTLQDAFGTDRAKWPPNTICFAVTETEDGRADVTVDTFYDMGIAQPFAGGGVTNG